MASRINYLPNDPANADEAPLRPEEATRTPSRGLRFQLGDQGRIAKRQYAIRTRNFNWWQCREAAYRAVRAWRNATGDPLRSWQRGKRLDLRPRHKRGIGGEYTRRSLRFFSQRVGGREIFGGSSVDVVSHEIGHAILDALRPEMYHDARPEVAAFHEAFADCVSLFTALEDEDTRDALVASAEGMTGNNFVQSLGEESASAVANTVGENDPSATPRRLRNDLRWRPMADLPTRAPADRVSIRPHSLSRVFSGAIYDCIVGVLEGAPSRDAASLRSAMRVVARTLAKAVKEAPANDRLFVAVGNAMLVADAALRNDNATVIRGAFQRHGLVLDGAPLQNSAALTVGSAPAAAGPARLMLDVGLRQELRERVLASPGSSLRVRRSRFTSGQRAHVVGARPISLGRVSRQLRNVEADVSRSVLIGADDGSPRLLDPTAHDVSPRAEVERFVRSLRDAGSIAGVTPRGESEEGASTHRISHGRRRSTLRRVRFACFHARSHRPVRSRRPEQEAEGRDLL